MNGCGSPVSESREASHQHPGRRGNRAHRFRAAGKALDPGGHASQVLNQVGTVYFAFRDEQFLSDFQWVYARQLSRQARSFLN
jgi:hypothetical protein